MTVQANHLNAATASPEIPEHPWDESTRGGKSSAQFPDCWQSGL